MSWGLWDAVDLAGGAAFAAGRRRLTEERGASPLPKDASESERAVNFGLWDVVGGPVGGKVLRGTENLASGTGRGLTTVGEGAAIGIPVLVIVGGVVVLYFATKKR